MADINAAIVDSYLERLHHLHANYSSQGNHKALGLRRSVGFLRQLGVLPSDKPKPLTGVERWLADFEHHLDQVVGNAPKTRSGALHLLQSGVDITVIALWLGHESIQTTHGYIEADLALKEQALQKVTPAGQAVGRFKADEGLLTFLASL